MALLPVRLGQAVAVVQARADAVRVGEVHVDLEVANLFHPGEPDRLARGDGPVRPVRPVRLEIATG